MAVFQGEDGEQRLTELFSTILGSATMLEGGGLVWCQPIRYQTLGDNYQMPGT